MSRIHEALRKAEADAGTLQSHEDLIGVAVPVIATMEEDRPAAVLPGRTQELHGFSHSVEWAPDAERMVFWRGDEQGVAAEQLRTLRSRFYHLREQQPFKSVLVSSPLPGEGKSFLSANLAHVLARRQNTRVALIDADLRCPRLHQMLGAPSKPGLSELLRGIASHDEIVQTGPIPNLFFVPGGSSLDNSSELLANGKLAGLLAELAQQCDWILVDSPALIPVSDGMILGGICDAALMVVQSGVTPLEEAERACQELKRKRLLGVVLNRAIEKHHSKYYYQGYYGQGKTATRKKRGAKN